MSNANKATDALGKLKAQMTGLAQAAKRLGNMTAGAFDSMSKSGQAAEAIDGLGTALENLGESTTIHTGAVNRSANQMKTVADRLIAIGGPLGRLSAASVQARQALQQQNQAVASGPTAMQRSFLRFAVIFKGVESLFKGMSKSLDALAPFTTAYSDLARQSIRGTALMHLNTKALKENQWAVHTNAIQINKATGMGAQAATELSVGVVNAFEMTGARAGLTAQAIADYSQELARSGTLAGLSAGEISEFNRKLVVNMGLSAKASLAIFQMIGNVQRFGLSGKQAIEVLTENEDKLMGVKPEIRDKFARQLLESSGAMTKAGVDFKKYASKLMEAKGSDVYKNAGMLAAFGGGTVQETVSLQRAANAGDKDAQLELLKLQSKAFESVGKQIGIDMADLRELQGKRATGQQLSTDEKGRLDASLFKLEEVLGKTVVGERIGIQDVNVGFGLGDKVKDLEKAIAEAKKNPVKTETASQGVMEENATVSERVEMNMAKVADLFSQSVNEWIRNAKIFADTTKKLVEAASGAFGGLGDMIGSIAMIGGLFAAGQGLKGLSGGRGPRPPRGGAPSPGSPRPSPTVHGPGHSPGVTPGPSPTLAPGVHTQEQIRAMRQARAGASAGKAAASAGAKTAGKSLVKKIPVIGLLAGLWFGAGRAMAGDWSGAGAELASGAASTIPGVGTAASVLIDSGLAVRDMQQAAQEANDLEQEQAQQNQNRLEQARPVVEELEPAELPKTNTARQAEESKGAIRPEDFKQLASKMGELLEEFKAFNEFMLAQQGNAFA